QLAEDAVQEAMLSIWLSTRVIPEGDARAWILSIVINKSRDLVRVRKQNADQEERMVAERRLPEMPVSDPSKDELIFALRKHIDRLPELEGQLLVYSYGANMPHRQIAELIGIPERTVSFKIQQALERLRGSLSRAGVAAVVPLVSAGNLFEALT